MTGQTELDTLKLGMDALHRNLLQVESENVRLRAECIRKDAELDRARAAALLEAARAMCVYCRKNDPERIDVGWVHDLTRRVDGEPEAWNPCGSQAVRDLLAVPAPKEQP